MGPQFRTVTLPCTRVVHSRGGDRLWALLSSKDSTCPGMGSLYLSCLWVAGVLSGLLLDVTPSRRAPTPHSSQWWAEVFLLRAPSLPAIGRPSANAPLFGAFLMFFTEKQKQKTKTISLCSIWARLTSQQAFLELTGHFSGCWNSSRNRALHSVGLEAPGPVQVLTSWESSAPPMQVLTSCAAS